MCTVQPQGGGNKDMHPSTSEGDLDFLVVASMFLTFGDTYSETHNSMGEDYWVKEQDYLRVH